MNKQIPRSRATTERRWDSRRILQRTARSLVVHCHSHWCRYTEDRVRDRFDAGLKEKLQLIHDPNLTSEALETARQHEQTKEHETARSQYVIGE